MLKQVTRFWRLGVGVLLWGTLFWFGDSSIAQAQATIAEAEASAPLCRFGVNTPAYTDTPITNFATAPLRLGWYIDYRTKTNPERPNGIKHTQVIQLRQTGTGANASYQASPNGSALRAAIAANRGADWIIGNEPDRRSFQNDLEPHVYAKAFHDLYEFIKKEDPRARVFAGAIVQPTPVRLIYLDKVLNSHLEIYGQALQTDGWAIHNFILNEANCEHYIKEDPDNYLQICWGADIPPGVNAVDGLRITVDQNDDFQLFTEQIVRFRQWMKDRGYGGQPVLLSEFGVLMPADFGFSPERVNAFMQKTFDYLLNETDPALGNPHDGNRLIQQFAWYSTNDHSFNGYLFEEGRNPARSPMGDFWVNYVQALEEEIDLYPTSIQTVGLPPTATNAADVTIQITIANQGNTLAAHPFTVRLYDADPAQGGKLIGQPQRLALAGCGEFATVKITWKNAPLGNYELYAVVDADNELAETDETNNIITSKFFFATDQVFLPALMRSSPIPLHTSMRLAQ